MLISFAVVYRRSLYHPFNNSRAKVAQYYYTSMKILLRNY